MAADLILSPEAERDVDQAYDWYESQRIGRGEDFMVRLEACFHGTPRGVFSFHCPISRNVR